MGASPGFPDCRFEHDHQTRLFWKPLRATILFVIDRGGWVETIFERVGALDVHKAQVTACVRVPGADGRREQQLAEFSTTVAGC